MATGPSKYAPLQAHLAAAMPPIEMTFTEIDRLVGGLPPTARARREWWANNATRHVQARAWLEVGRRVETVDLVSERVTFS